MRETHNKSLCWVFAPLRCVKTSEFNRYVKGKKGYIIKDNQYSRTADMVASSHAWHRLVSDNLVFDDPFAIHLTSPMRRFVLTKPLLRWMLSLIAARLSPSKPIINPLNNTFGV